MVFWLCLYGLYVYVLCQIFVSFFHEPVLNHTKDMIDVMAAAITKDNQMPVRPMAFVNAR